MKIEHQVKRDNQIRNSKNLYKKIYINIFYKYLINKVRK